MLYQSIACAALNLIELKKYREDEKKNRRTI